MPTSKRWDDTRNAENLLYLLNTESLMKIRCPECKKAAELSDNFTNVKCLYCGFDMTYGDYVKYVAYKDARYRDILSDYK